MNIDVGDYPLFESPIVVAAPDLLHELADAYTSTLVGEIPQMERFLFGYVPIEVFDRIFSGDIKETSGLMWLLHLSGYFGGRWLRGEIEIAQPTAPLTLVSIEPNVANFLVTTEKAEHGINASCSDDETVLHYSKQSLYNTQAKSEGSQPIQGLADNFGYNKGYLLEILARPPEGCNSPEKYQINGRGLFQCVYASPKLKILPLLTEVQEAIAISDSKYVSLVKDLIPLQEIAEPRGRSVWSSGLSVQGFPQVAYDQLLDVSSSFLETVHATGLTMIRSVIEENADQARRGSVADAAMTIWLSAYMVGLLNGKGDKVIPKFK